MRREIWYVVSNTLQFSILTRNTLDTSGQKKVKLVSENLCNTTSSWKSLILRRTWLCSTNRYTLKPIMCSFYAIFSSKRSPSNFFWINGHCQNRYCSDLESLNLCLRRNIKILCVIFQSVHPGNKSNTDTQYHPFHKATSKCTKIPVLLFGC